jgi:multiple sugar transport system substrate-binding protein
MPLPRWTLSRRQYTTILLGTGAAALLHACQPVRPGQTPGGPQTGPIEIEVWTGWTEKAAENIEKILDGYSRSQTKYRAKHVVTPDLQTKLLAAVAAGNPPGAAVIFNGGGQVYTLAEEDALLPLDDMGKEKLASLKSWVHPAIWDLGTYKGKLYALAMWTQSYAVYYNKKQVVEAGLDPQKPPADFTELDQYGDRLTQRDGSGNITRMGLDITWAQLLIGAFRGRLVDDAGRKILANAPENIAAIDWMVQRWKRYDPKRIQDFNQSLAGAGERSGVLDPFIAGKRSLNVTGPWHIGTIKQFAPPDFEWGVWPLPGPRAGVKAGCWTYGDVFVVPKGTKAPQASFDLVSAMTGATGDRNNYTQLFVVWPCVNNPTSAQMLADPTFKKEVIDACPGYTVFNDHLYKNDYHLFPPKIPTAASYMNLLGAETEKARLGQKTTKEALDTVTQQAQKELDDWLARRGK